MSSNGIRLNLQNALLSKVTSQITEYYKKNEQTEKVYISKKGTYLSFFLRKKIVSEGVAGGRLKIKALLVTNNLHDPIIKDIVRLAQKEGISIRIETDNFSFFSALRLQEK